LLLAGFQYLLLGLGWLAGILDLDTLARIPARAMDGVRELNLLILLFNLRHFPSV
jgi:hypothetical protein